MKLQGEHTIDAPRAEVWEAVLDPDVLTRVLPGCEDFHQVGENEYEGVLKIKVGPVQGKFKGKVTLSDLQPPESYHLHVKGQGPPGFVDGEGELHLDDLGAQTRLRYDLDAKVGGRIASVGQRLIDSSAKSITRQAMAGLEAQVAARSGPAAAGASAGSEPPPVATPSQSELAANVARDVAADLVPPERRPLVLGVAAAAVLAILVLLMRAC